MQPMAATRCHSMLVWTAQSCHFDLQLPKLLYVVLSIKPLRQNLASGMECNIMRLWWSLGKHAG